MPFLDLLNSREIAWLICMAIFIVVAFFFKGVRKSLAWIIKAFFQKKILAFTAVVTVFSSCCIWVLYCLRLWDMSLLKDTIVWFFSVPILAMFKISKITEDKRYFGKAVKELLAFSVVAEFVINTFTFNLGVELVLVLFITLITMMLAVAEKDDKYAKVRSILENTLSLIGLLLIINVIFQIIAHITQFTSWQTLNNFLLAPALTLLYLPFLYLTLVYVEYETTFSLLPRTIKNIDLLRKARRMAILNFGLNWRALKRWRINLFKQRRLETFSELKATFQHEKELKQLEKNPPVISPNEGWSPYEAKNFFLSEGVVTGYYDKAYDNTFFATSPYVKLNNALILQDTMVYTVEGTREKATTLTLSFIIYAPFHADKIIPVIRFTNIFFRKAVNSDNFSAVEDAIKNNRSITIKKSPFCFSVKKNDFVHKEKGYSISISISIEKEPTKDRT